MRPHTLAIRAADTLVFWVKTLIETTMYFTTLPVNPLLEMLGRGYSTQLRLEHYLIFPLTGIMQMGLAVLAAMFANANGLPTEVIYPLLAVWFLFLSGFIHLDALIDTTDALFAPEGRRFEVAKEPTVGALGVAKTIAYVALYVTVIPYFLNHQTYEPLFLAVLLPRIGTLYVMVRDAGRKEPEQSVIDIDRGFCVRTGTLQAAILLYLISIYLLLPDPMLFLVALGIHIYILEIHLPKMVNRLGFVNGDVLGYTVTTGEVCILISLTMVPL